MAQNIFGSSRRKLTLLYSIVMTIFLVTLLFAMHKTMEWAIISEQARDHGHGQQCCGGAGVFQPSTPRSSSTMRRPTRARMTASSSMSLTKRDGC